MESFVMSSNKKDCPVIEAVFGIMSIPLLNAGFRHLPGYDDLLFKVALDALQYN